MERLGPAAILKWIINFLLHCLQAAISHGLISNWLSTDRGIGTVMPQLHGK